MKKEEREKFEKEINDINKSISEKEKEIISSDEYKKLEQVKPKLRESKRGDELNYSELKREVYNKYTYGLWGGYYVLRLSNIKPSVKHGIKVGLGMKNLKSIEDNTVKVVRELINKDLEEPKIKKLKQKISAIDNKIMELINSQDKLINDKVTKLQKERDNVFLKFYKKKNTKDKKLEEQKKEVNEKVKNLPHYIPKITKEINKRLILDGLKKIIWQNVNIAKQH